MSEGLPEGWATVSFEDCVEILDAQRKPVKAADRQRRIKGKAENALFPYYGATGLAGYIDDFLFDEELLLVGEDGVPFYDLTKKKSYIITGKSWVNNHAHVVKAIDMLSSNIFLKHYLDQFDYHGYVTGTTRLKLNQGEMKKIPVPLPPLNEQKRIADKLDTVLAAVGRVKDRLEKAEALLKRFRQSVLNAATTGKLTEEWRAALGGEGDYLVKNNAECLPLHEVPSSWSWCLLKEISDINSGVTKGGKQKAGKKIKVPYLRVANVQRGFLDLNEVKEIEILEEHVQKYLLKYGDVLFTEGGDRDKLGRGWVWFGDLPICIHQNHIFRARLNDELALSKYVSWYGNSQGLNYFLHSGVQVVNLANINKTILGNLPIAIPPLKEQQEIVLRVERLFGSADKIEERLAQTRKRVERLESALLAKAFRGELVPQDPSDEPASELLKRIKAERDQQEQQVKPRRRKRAG